MIAAAGSGSRLGAGGPKAFTEVAGAPLLAWSIRALAGARTIGLIVIAAPTDRDGVERARSIAAETDETARVEVVAGGATRGESVALAMQGVATALVCIHDAARPLVSAALVDRVLGRMEDPGLDGAIAAAPIADTVKRVFAPGPAEEALIVETVSRHHLWSAQTPQAFRAEALRRAQQLAITEGRLAAATDEAMLVELAGGSVAIEPAAELNLKLTTEDDRELIEARLRGRA